MAAYVLVQANIVDEASFSRYEAIVPATVAAYSGRYLVRGGSPRVAVGTALGYSRVVIIEFPTAERAEAWFRSPEYAAARAVKGESMSGSLVILDGVPPAR